MEKSKMKYYWRLYYIIYEYFYPRPNIYGIGKHYITIKYCRIKGIKYINIPLKLIKAKVLINNADRYIELKKE